MNSTLQTFLTILMISEIFVGFYWAGKKETTYTIWCMGFALILGVMLF